MTFSVDPCMVVLVKVISVNFPAISAAFSFNSLLSTRSFPA